MLHIRRAPFLVVGVVALGMVSNASMGDLLWDNDLDTNGFNGRAMSPPGFPDIVVCDDFTIPPTDESGWILQGFRLAAIEDKSWNSGARLEVFILTDDNNHCPRDLLAVIQDSFERVPTGRRFFNRDEYIYTFEFADGYALPPGTYHICARNPDGSGSGTNYWTTSSGGEGTDETGCFSLNDITWQKEGPGWHRAFEIHGVVGPTCAADLDHSGDVGFDDLLLLLAAWGPCKGECPEDLNGNNDVDFDDLLILLAAWGPCE